MERNAQKNFGKITNERLTPGKPLICHGNGEYGYDYHCHECDYIFTCFPDMANLDQELEDLESIELPPPSKRHKIRMNRIFRENTDGTFIPYPEVDCFYEKLRSRIVRKFKLNDFAYNRKMRKRKKRNAKRYGSK